MICNAAAPKLSGPVSVWQETFPIRFAAIDRSNRLTLDAVFQFFQEVAISHAENLGVGREDMAKTKQSWILSRMSVLVTQRPRYCETITVRSWPRGGDKLFALRDYDIRNEAGVPVVQARSGWIVLDMEKRRPMRPNSVMDALPMNEGLNALESGNAGLAGRDNLQKSGERRALYTDIDYNGHVNNIRYIQWIEDTLDSKALEDAAKMRMDINYLNEVLPGSVTEIWYAPVSDDGTADFGRPNAAYAFEGRNAGNNQAMFRAELRLWD